MLCHSTLHRSELVERAFGETAARHSWLRGAALPQLPTRLLEPGQELHSVLPDPELGRFPVVIKTRRGSKGVGVHLASDVKDLELIRGRYARDGFAVLVQRYVKPVREYRALVVGDRGGHADFVHLGAFALSDADGRLVASAGNADNVSAMWR